jgi:hypothetical protein
MSHGTRMAGLVAAVVTTIVFAACATTPPPPASTAPIEPTPTPQSTTAAIEEDVVRETRKTAAEQLECPAEELAVTCTKRDVHGGCIAIQAKGCGKVLDYDFGNE